jgi:hypothetical protein
LLIEKIISGLLSEVRYLRQERSVLASQHDDQVYELKADVSRLLSRIASAEASKAGSIASSSDAWAPHERTFEVPIYAAKPTAGFSKSIWSQSDNGLPFDTSYTGSDDLTYCVGDTSGKSSATLSDSLRGIWSDDGRGSVDSSRVRENQEDISIVQTEPTFFPGKSETSYSPTNFSYLVDKIVKTNGMDGL